MRILIKGIVQGVGFRPYIYRLAHRHSLKGFIRNLGTGEVEIVVQGADKSLTLFQQDIVQEKPPLAVIDSLSVTGEAGNDETFTDFLIVPSEEKGEKPSFIPPDVAICDACLKEMREKGNRREGYYFTSCTDCGPRFTIIEDMPYDRPKTTMKDFPLCSLCKGEYTNPLDRRYHAQPIACPDCGPAIKLYDKEKKEIICSQPIKRAAQLLDEGRVLVVKGIGGMHLVMRADKSEPLFSFRRKTGRLTKPYAVMARDLAAVKSFAEVSAEEEEELLSLRRPIVVLAKNCDYYLSPEVSRLHTVGVMLPYTGLHYILFDYLKADVLVMTSANLPGLPMTKDNAEAFDLPADYFLLHEREIYIQCDDSVVRFVNGRRVYLRRSRGVVPLPVTLPARSKKVFVSLGAEQNTAICLVREDKAVLTQYLGTLKNWETEVYYRKTLNHFLRMFRMPQPEKVVCDLHPGYETTNLASELTVEHGAELIRVQHHLAHFASVLAEQPLEEAIGLICDGTGYGLDGKVWGGEVFIYAAKQFKRFAKLEDQPLLGGDLAVKYPSRMALGILHKVLEPEALLKLAAELFPEPKERQLLLQQLEQKNYLLTSSTGRILDSIAALTGICRSMGYEGEPAMQLESLARQGKNGKKGCALSCCNEDGLWNLGTTELLLWVYQELQKKAPVSEIAYTAQLSLAEGFVSLVGQAVKETGIKNVCCSGGVFYNQFFAEFIAAKLNNNGLRVLFNQQAGCGDNGISLGQAYYALMLERGDVLCMNQP